MFPTYISSTFVIKGTLSQEPGARVNTIQNLYHRSINEAQETNNNDSMSI